METDTHRGEATGEAIFMVAMVVVDMEAVVGMEGMEGGEMICGERHGTMTMMLVDRMGKYMDMVTTRLLLGGLKHHLRLLRGEWDLCHPRLHQGN